ncbi:MAG: CBS domain-containing protein [Opitutales bacterium]
MSLKQITVATLLREKSDTIFCTSEDATVAQAVEELNRHKVGSVIVKSGEKVVGVFTERDVLTRVISEARDPGTTIVREVMTGDFKWITIETKIDAAMQRMTDDRVRHLPVFDGEHLCGVVSIGDVTRWLLKVNRMEAENLRKYIASEYPG